MQMKDWSSNVSIANILIPQLSKEATTQFVTVYSQETKLISTNYFLP